MSNPQANHNNLHKDEPVFLDCPYSMGPNPLKDFAGNPERYVIVLSGRTEWGQWVVIREKAEMDQYYKIKGPVIIRRKDEKDI